MTQNALKCVRFHNVRGLLLVARILHRTALASRDDLRNSAERSTTRVWMFFGVRRFVGYGLQPAILLVASQKGESNEKEQQTDSHKEVNLVKKVTPMVKVAVKPHSANDKDKSMGQKKEAEKTN